MTAQFDYAYAGTSIRVRCAETSLLEWLNEFLAPWFDIEGRADHDVLIEGNLDPGEYDRMLARGPAKDGGNLDWFSLDGHFESHPRWESDGGGFLCHDEKRRVFYSFDPEERVGGFVAEADRASVRIGLLRLVRELATAHALARGLIHIHGSAFARNGRGVVITGAKTAGKTSLLINALGTGEVDFLTNDRLFIDAADVAENGVGGRDAAIVGIGMPTIVNSRVGCLEMFPRQRELLRGTPYHRDLSRRECREGIRAKIRNETRWPPSLSPAQFCEVLGVKAIRHAQLTSIVFPVISRDIETFALEALDESVATEEIYAGVFRSATPQKIPEVFRNVSRESIPDESRVRRAARTLARNLNCYRCLLGPEAYRDISLSREFVRQITSG